MNIEIKTTEEFLPVLITVSAYILGFAALQIWLKIDTKEHYGKFKSSFYHIGLLINGMLLYKLSETVSIVFK